MFVNGRTDNNGRRLTHTQDTSRVYRALALYTRTAHRDSRHSCVMRIAIMKSGNVGRIRGCALPRGLIAKDHFSRRHFFSVGAGPTCRHRTAVAHRKIYFCRAEAAAVKHHPHQHGLLGAVQWSVRRRAANGLRGLIGLLRLCKARSCAKRAWAIEGDHMPTRLASGSFRLGRVLPDNITSSFARQWRAHVTVDMQW